MCADSAVAGAAVCGCDDAVAELCVPMRSMMLMFALIYRSPTAPVSTLLLRFQL